MKLYTRRGDRGQTDLFGGQRVPKHDLRVEAYGTVDELNATVGLARAACGDGDHDADIAEPLEIIQSRLFEIGADLATPPPPGGHDAASDNKSLVPRITQTQIDELEAWIDRASDAVPPMKTFVLPAGTELSARLHVARTVCRRAERLVTHLADHADVGDAVGIYLNRLSDLLFAMARHANHRAGVGDVPWLSPRQKRHDLFEGE